MLLAGVLVVAGVVVAGMFPGVQKVFAGFFKDTTSQVVRYKVTKGKLPVTVVERGNLESSNNDDVINEVEGQTTIIFIKPEGSQVKKGDLVCELDSATLRDNLTNQEITTKQAFANLENAQKTLEVAQIAVNEYIDGTFPQERQQIESEIKLSMSELERATERLKWSEAMKEKNYVSDSSVISDKLSKQKSDISLANAQKKLHVLDNYTKLKQVTELQASVKKSESDKLAKEATYSLEKSKEEKLRKQIVKCKLFAPNDGLVVYANDQNQMRGGQGSMIAEGEAVRERQKIFSLPDISKMRVNTKVHESMIDRVARDLPAKVKFDALPTLPLVGKVETVQPLPDQGGWFNSDVKMYTTLVSIDGYNSALRPGMTAEVTILIAQLDDVLFVPVQSVIQAQGKDYVYVLTPEGPVRKQITLGITNQKVIEVKEGLKEGDEVAMNWNTLMTEEEKNTLFSSSTKGSSKDKDWANAPVGAPKLAPGLTPGLTPKGEAGVADAAKAKGKGAGRRGGMPGMDPALQAKMKNIPREDMRKVFAGTPEEKSEVLKAAGFTDDEVKKLEDMAKAMMSGGGGMGGGGMGGPGGGGMGGPGGGMGGGPGGGGGGPGGGGRPGGGGGLQ